MKLTCEQIDRYNRASEALTHLRFLDMGYLQHEPEDPVQRDMWAAHWFSSMGYALPQLETTLERAQKAVSEMRRIVDGAREPWGMPTT
jgi:flagellar biosynthesis chaperone FliJ